MPNHTKDSVLAVILNFNGWEETLVCIDSILKQTYKNIHIMLIDNGSKDESLEQLNKYNHNDKITFHKEPINLGFAGGVNVGIKYAIQNSYTYVALINNDAILTDNWVAGLTESLNKHSTSIVTGLLLTQDGKKIESTGDAYSKYGLPFPRQRGEPSGDAVASGYVFGGTAGASIYKTSLFEHIGLFDEKFFAYFEDTDISYRAQLAGHTAYYEKSVIAYHNHGTTSGKMPGFTVYQTFKNLPVFLWKNVPLRLFPGTAFRFYSSYFIMYIRAITRGQFIIATKGVLRSISLFPHALSSRKKIQKLRSVSIEYLNSIIYQDLPPTNKSFFKRILGK